MWADDAVFYQFYPLGVCGAPRENDGVLSHRLGRLADWIPHLERLSVNAVYLSPVFQSDCHGYDTRDYRTVDCRLGTNEDLARLIESFHAHGIRVVLDGVFNHVGRGFWAFEDVREKKWDSPYKDWFYVNFDGDSAYADGFWYEGWEGFYNLVKLNLRNPAVVDYLLESVRLWVEEFHIDGLRLDVAYCLDPDFQRRLRAFCDGLKPDFFLLGEMLHGDYNRLLADGMLHSVTNYECYKGLWSALNSRNLFEIVHSLKRQFGPEPWTLYKGRHLLCFADNHDTTRAASVLQNPNHLPLLYGMVFGMPGIPCVYYGSEWGTAGAKIPGESDWNLRPEIERPMWNDLTDRIAAMARAHRESPALRWGDFQDLALTNLQTVFRRRVEGETVLVCVNADERPFFARFDAGAAGALDLLTGETVPLNGGAELPPYSVQYLKLQ